MNIDDTLKKLSGEKVRILVKDIGDSDLVLIEGDERSLLALSALLVAVASSGNGHIQLSPTMAGSKLFKKGSTRGFYIRVEKGNQT